MGLKLFYPERRLINAFEPGSNSSRRNVFQEQYSRAFSAADIICIRQPPGMKSISESERLDARKLVDDIRGREKDANFFPSRDDLVEFLLRSARPGDSDCLHEQREL